MSADDSSASPTPELSQHEQAWREIGREMRVDPVWGVIALAFWALSPRIVSMLAYFIDPSIEVAEGQCHYDAATAMWWPWWDECVRLGVAIALLLYMRLGLRQPMRSMGLDKPRVLSDGKFLLAMLLGGGSIFVALVGVLYGLFELRPDWVGAPADGDFVGWMRSLAAVRDFSWEYAIFMVVYAPVVEEVVFRGWLYAHLRTASRRVLPSLVLSALIFAVAHGNALPISQLIGGFVFGWAYERTRQVYVPIILHMAGNGTLFVLSWYVIEELPQGSFLGIG